MTDLERATEAGRAAKEAQDDARGVAIAALRALEAELMLLAAESGGQLRGLRNLAGPNAAKLRAANVRATDPARALGRVGGPALVVALDGMMCMATWVPMLRAFALRPAADYDLRIEDVAALAATTVWVLEQHQAACERTSASYAAAADLSRRVLAAMGGGR